jgi:hypothetical protein
MKNTSSRKCVWLCKGLGIGSSMTFMDGRDKPHFIPSKDNTNRKESEMEREEIIPEKELEENTMEEKKKEESIDIESEEDIMEEKKREESIDIDLEMEKESLKGVLDLLDGMLEEDEKKHNDEDDPVKAVSWTSDRPQRLKVQPEK